MTQSRQSFGCLESFERSRRHMLSGLITFGRRTITSLVRTQNRHRQDWTAEYRFYSRNRSNEQALFELARRQVEAHLAAEDPLVTAMDDSLLRKSGRKVYGVRYLRDPMSPPFAVNFVRGLRVLQLSAALPDGTGAARLIPVDFQHAVPPQKPPKKASAQQLEQYELERAKRNINTVGAQRIERLRQQMDQSGGSQRRLIVSVDGRFTNKTLLKGLPQRTVLIGRLRKDAVLHYLPQAQPDKGRKRKYGPPAPTPEQLLKDESVPWQTLKAYACGKIHEFSIKKLNPVVLRMNGAAMPVQVMVIKPLQYRLKIGGKLLYRQPAFLVCTDPDLPIEQFLQDYLWRWDIEVNFRDEKTVLNVGQAQVRTEHSTQQAPALAVAAYSLLLLAAVKTYGRNGVPDREHQPKWYQREADKRATTNELINQLRVELWASALRPSCFSDFTTAMPPDQKSEKFEFNPAASMFTSIR